VVVRLLPVRIIVVYTTFSGYLVDRCASWDIIARIWLAQYWMLPVKAIQSWYCCSCDILWISSGRL